MLSSYLSIFSIPTTVSVRVSCLTLLGPGSFVSGSEAPCDWSRATHQYRLCVRPTTDRRCGAKTLPKLRMTVACLTVVSFHRGLNSSHKLSPVFRTLGPRWLPIPFDVRTDSSPPTPFQKKLFFLSKCIRRTFV